MITNSTRVVRATAALMAFASTTASLAQQAEGPAVADQSRDSSLAEIVVTAQKRTELLLDVPLPVTAISTQDLAQNNQTRLADFYAQVPGLSIAPSAEASTQILSIRGLSNVAGNPTVGVTIDDMPLGSLGGGGNAAGDIDPDMLASIEVLRGPQGTLYGASSMGGLIKYVTADPTMDAVSGRMSLGTESIYNAANLGYSARSSVNLPVTGDLAMRFSGFTHFDPGYIDNVLLGEEGVNSSRSSGGQATVLWRPEETFSIKLNALYQNVQAHGANDSDLVPGAGYLKQINAIGAGPSSRTVEAYWADIKANLGFFDVTSITGYNRTTNNDSFDYSGTLGQVYSFLYGVTGGPAFETADTFKFSQEVRLTKTVDQFDFLLGGFYTHEATSYDVNLYAEDPITGVQAAHFLNSTMPSRYNEYAGFANVTYHVTDQFILQAGARKSEIKQSSDVDYIGPYAEIVLQNPTPSVFQPTERANGSPFTYLGTAQYKFTPDFNVYTRISSGYRAGGPNPDIPGVPNHFQPDTTTDYELGTKGSLLSHRLSFDVSLYYIDWKNIALNLVAPPTNYYTGNAGGAKSQGLEISVEGKPTAGLKLSGWVDFDEAVLTKTFPPDAVAAGTYGVAGDPLPNSARFTGNLSADQSFPLVRGIDGFVGGTVIYVGDRRDALTDSPVRQDLPPYAQTDLRAGAKWNTWTVNLFATNVTNRQGLISGGLGHIVPYSFFYIQPRTVGLNVSTSF
jgi:iron complex outermembrane recepter protein